MKVALRLVLASAAFAACAAVAQQYRWVDEQGRARYSDSPPPPTARNVGRFDFAPAEPAPPQPPFELTRVQQQFPVSLYTSPNCKEICARARELLNERGIPFKEILVWDEEANEDLKNVSGSNEVPTIVVGRTVQRGFEPGGYDALLDSAGYPKAGVLPERSQRAPDVPADYDPPARARPVAEPVQTVAPGKRGPYDPSGLTGGQRPRPGQYDPSGLAGPAPRAGQYGIPGQQ